MARDEHKGRANLKHGASSMEVGNGIWLNVPSGWGRNRASKISGIIRELSPRRVHVWFGHTGLGQKTWPFDRKTGAPVGPAKESHTLSDCVLDVTSAHALVQS